MLLKYTSALFNRNNISNWFLSFSCFSWNDPQGSQRFSGHRPTEKPTFGGIPWADKTTFFFFSWLLQTTLSHWLFIRHNRNPVFYGWIHTNQNWHTREATLQLWNYHTQLDKKALFPKACDASREQYFAKKCFIFYTKYSGKLLVRQCANCFLGLFYFLMLFRLPNRLKKDVVRSYSSHEHSSLFKNQIFLRFLYWW